MVGTRDLRGATTIRETAAILANARLFVGTVSFLMHVAPGCRMPERDYLQWAGSPLAIRLRVQSQSLLGSTMRTMLALELLRIRSQMHEANITVSDVTNAIGQMLSRPRGPLEVETVEVLARDLGVYSESINRVGPMEAISHRPDQHPSVFVCILNWNELAETAGNTSPRFSVSITPITRSLSSITAQQTIRLLRCAGWGPVSNSSNIAKISRFYRRQQRGYEARLGEWGRICLAAEQ